MWLHRQGVEMSSINMSEPPSVTHGPESVDGTEKPGHSPRQQPTEEEILQKPWKYVGYDGYASFLASDDDHFLRSVGDIALRVPYPDSLRALATVRPDWKRARRTRSAGRTRKAALASNPTTRFRRQLYSPSRAWLTTSHRPRTRSADQASPHPCLTS